MAINEELRAKILRYYHVEKWRVGTIATQLRIHHATVERVLTQAGIDKKEVIKQKSIVDPYAGFIIEQLKQYPTLTARRLYDMVRERGYPGGSNHFRHIVALYRPKKPAEAYLRLRTLPGEQAQIDWGAFGSIMIGCAKRQVSAFVMVLSYSRKIFLRFYLDQRLSNFLDGHQRAFIAFNGVPRVLLYDNLKTAVLERQGDAIRFNPELLKFAAYYRYEPRPVAVARGNEKGRVEKAIRYIRDNFFAARQWQDIDDLNQQAEEWCNEGSAAFRPCPEDNTQSVKDVFIEEQSHLIALPANPYPTEEHVEVKVGKTPYVRFDLNDYSVPHTHVRCTLTVRATQKEVFILDGINKIAIHPRSYDKGKQIEDERHITKLIQMKRKARRHRSQDRLISAIPLAQNFLTKAATHGYSLRTMSRELLALLQEYGAAELAIAMQESLNDDVPHPNNVRHHLQKRREQQHKPPPIAVQLPNDERVRNQIIQPHALSNYNQLQSTEKED